MSTSLLLAWRVVLAAFDATVNVIAFFASVSLCSLLELLASVFLYVTRRGGRHCGAVEVLRGRPRSASAVWLSRLCSLSVFQVGPRTAFSSGAGQLPTRRKTHHQRPAQGANTPGGLQPSLSLCVQAERTRGEGGHLGMLLSLHKDFLMTFMSFFICLFRDTFFI